MGQVGNKPLQKPKGLETPELKPQQPIQGAKWSDVADPDLQQETLEQRKKRL